MKAFGRAFQVWLVVFVIQTLLGLANGKERRIHYMSTGDDPVDFVKSKVDSNQVSLSIAVFLWFSPFRYLMDHHDVLGNWRKGYGIRQKLWPP